MERVIWEGKASWLSAINGWDVFLTLITFGVWVIVPLIKMIALMGKSYRVTDQRIVIKEGVASTSAREVEYFRVKDLSINQNMIQKVFGLGNIALQSADGRLEINGIPNAYQLREDIRTAVNNIRKDNNVRVSEQI